MAERASVTIVRVPGWAAVWGLLLGLAGCSEAVAPDADPSDGWVEVTPSEVEVLVGDTIWLEATVYGGAGEAREEAPLRWGFGPGWRWAIQGLPGSFTDRRYIVRAIGPGEVWWVARSRELADSARIEVSHREVALQEMVWAGGNTTCALDVEGYAWCWGSQRQGKGPRGVAQYPLSAPAPVSTERRFSSLGVGSALACGLKEDGEAWCWGSSAQHLGIGPVDHAEIGEEPLRVEGGHRFVSLAAGGVHTCALTAGGEVYCWGLDGAGAFGNPEPADYCGVAFPTPCARVPVRAADGMRFERIDSADGFTCGVNEDGEVWCWGENWSLQLGQATEEECQTLLLLIPCSRRPLRVEGLPSAREVALGWQFACALTTEGEAYCWGHNGLGELGDGSGGDPVGPVKVATELRFETLAVGAEHACGLLADGTVWCWGSARRKQTGTVGQSCMHGPMQVECEPVPALAAGGQRFRRIAAGAWHTCGIGLDGLPYCWGYNSSGQLGNGDRSVRSILEPGAVLGALPPAGNE